jgi:hypothetical protein
MRRRYRHRLDEYVRYDIEQIIRDIKSAGKCEEDVVLDRLTHRIIGLYEWWFKRHPQLNAATNLTMSIQGENTMASFEIVITDTGATAQFQFDNSAGSAVAGPNDSVTGAPVAPEASSDTPTVLTVASSVAGATPGAWSAALTPVAAGVANVSPVALTNSDGSAVNETEGPNVGQPFVLPAAVQVTVTPDNTPTGFTLTVTG